MRTRTLAAAVALTLLAAPAALAGGWAAVQLDSLPQDGHPAGEPWRVELTVLQHGRTPLEGLEPRVRIRDAEGLERTIAAKPAGGPGRYRAEVVFPSSGRWEYEVLDGFVDAVHTYPPVRIGARAAAAPAPAGRPDASAGGSDWPAGLAAALFAVAAVAVLALSRRGAGPAPA